VLEKVGRQPVQYVANIHRYYTAYRLAEEMQGDPGTSRAADRRADMLASEAVFDAAAAQR